MGITGILRTFAPAVLAAALLAVARPAAAQAGPCGITPGEAACHDEGAAPLAIEFETRLDFDTLLLSGSGPGSARLGPDGDSLVSGSVESIGRQAIVGRMILTGQPNAPVTVDLPDRIELVGMSGAVISVSRLVTDLPAAPSLDSQGRLIVNIGGLLEVAGDLDGDFRGNLLVRADYL